MNPLAGFSPLSSWRWLSLALAFLAGGIVGGVFTNAVRTAQIADLTAAHAAQQTAVAQIGLQRWQAAAARADAAETALAQQTAVRQQTLKETKHALSALTTDHLCLSGAAVRLLNGPGLRLDRLPEPAGQPDAAAEPFATDTDLGAWILDATDAFEHCRALRQALIDWESRDD